MNKLGKLLIDYHIILIIMIVLLFPFLQFRTVQNEIIVTNESELMKAVNHPEANIIINDTIYLESYVAINNEVTIGGTGVITVANPHRHFVVRENGILTLVGDLTLTQQEGYTGYGGGITVNAGVLVMHGGHITGNNWLIAPEDLGQRFIDDHINRYRIGSGGGVRVANGGLFRVYDGLISHNEANYGGGVNLIDFGSRFVMRGGYIQYNYAELGGGLHHSGYFSPSPPPMIALRIYGGTINENTARFVGGGVYFIGSSGANLHGGQIRDNQAAAHGGVYSRFINTGTGVRITNNYPANFNEHNMLFYWIITPTVTRLVPVFIIAIIGSVYSERKCKKKSIFEDWLRSHD